MNKESSNEEAEVSEPDYRMPDYRMPEERKARGPTITTTESWSPDLHADQQARITALESQLKAAEERVRFLEEACAKASNEICQVLGKALGFPRYCDDQAVFPGTTPEDGVCVHEHVDITLAMLAAEKLKAAEAERMQEDHSMAHMHLWAEYIGKKLGVVYDSDLAVDGEIAIGEAIDALLAEREKWRELYQAAWEECEWRRTVEPGEFTSDMTEVRIGQVSYAHDALRAKHGVT